MFQKRKPREIYRKKCVMRMEKHKKYESEKNIYKWVKLFKEDQNASWIADKMTETCFIFNIAKYKLRLYKTKFR